MADPPTKSSKPPKKRDGRTLRAERSRLAVARAMLELIREGHPRPTAANVAERAGVSLRLVFHHFNDMESVLRRASELQAREIAPMLPVDFSGVTSFDQKVAIFVERRANLYEAVAPVRRAMRMAMDSLSAETLEGLHLVRRLKREQFDHLFAEQIEALPDDVREDVRAACHAAQSWLNWENLRTHQGTERSIEDCMRIVRVTLHRLLGVPAT